ncbi:MAG: TlpA family protein disulfide reductase [Hyphomonadaceae bacterium]|nr:TlpA family protein disulfide reductase [Hyphomonadaceae bacterium]
MAELPGFELRDLDDAPRAFPAAKPSLICFVKEDCETCNLAAPVLEAFAKTYGEAANIWMISQTRDGSLVLKDRHGLTLPILDDSDLKISFAYGFDIVPALYWCPDGRTPDTQCEGFVKTEWQGVDRDMASTLNCTATAIDWDTLPDWRPGCGSKHLDPEILDRLMADAEDSPIRARKIEIASADDVAEFMFDQGFSDGLPLVPPTPERVMRMLSGTSRSPKEVIAQMPPNMGEASIEKIAINAVMAGCKPEYLPVVIAAIEAICTDAFNVHGVMATTMGASPVIVVNGPIRERLGMNSGLMALGTGNRANATIGRAVRLAVRNIGGAKPGGTDRSTLGSPMKFTMCFAEREGRSPWAPLHVERGFKATDSVVTVFAMTSGPVHIVDQESRAPDEIAGTLGLGLESMFLPKYHMMPVDALLVVCPEHIDTLMRDGEYDKDRLRDRIQDVTRRPLRDMVADEVSGAGMTRAAAAKLDDAQLDNLVPKFAKREHIHIVVAGSDAGKFSSAYHGWVTGPMGSQSVSRKIEET